MPDRISFAAIFAAALLCEAAIGWNGEVRADDVRRVAATEQVGASIEMAATIDRHFSEIWSREAVEPEGTASDATFLRRAYLDLLGRIATVPEAKQFLSSDLPDRRARLLRQLIDSPEHARHMARFWRQVWIPQAESEEFADLAKEIETWLEPALQRNLPYDQLVRSVLVASTPRASSDISPRRADEAPRVLAAASEYSPANMAANVSRAFLGVNIGCAQCHDHPFARWSQQQFWEMAAFFVAPAPEPTATEGPFQLIVADSQKVARPRFLTGYRPQWTEPLESDQAVRQLADWTVDPANPYFARNGVNQLWSLFFGRGLVEPRDDLTEANRSPHSPLLEELARQFASAGFDMQTLTTSIVLSRPYHLASIDKHRKEGDAQTDHAVSERLFQAMPLRGLSGAQLYDSLRTASGIPPLRSDLSTIGEIEERQRVVDQFSIRDPLDAERSVDQALTWINGRLMARFTSPSASPILQIVAETPFLERQERLDILFLATLNRRPRGREKELFDVYLDETIPDAPATTPVKQAEAYADIFWVLLHSTEFQTLR